MNELLAQGPEFAGENISFVSESSPVDQVANALLLFWDACAANNEVAAQEARRAITAAGGTSLAAINRAHELRRGTNPVETDTGIVEKPVPSLADLHFEAMERGDEDAMHEIESQMFKDEK